MKPIAKTLTSVVVIGAALAAPLAYADKLDDIIASGNLR